MSCGSVTSQLCLVMGMVMPVMSASWKASVPMSARETLAVIATSGTESMYASAIGGHEVGRAGAGGAHAHADLAGGVGEALGGVAADLLVADEDVFGFSHP